MADDRPHPVKLVIDNAEEIPRAFEDTPSPDKGGGDPPGGFAPKLPEDCPIVPLGALDDTSYYLDALKQLRKMPAREHSRLGIVHLFGHRTHLLEVYWPRKKEITVDGAKEWVVTGWKPEEAALALMSAAALKGVWDPFERVRERGAWLGDKGELVLHCGDVLLAGGKWIDPGQVGRFVYPAGPPTLRPAPAPGKGKHVNPADELLSLLSTWNWRRGAHDARLLLGWICASYLGGALDWRPVAWITGGQGTGKSTLHKMIGRLYDGGLIQVSEASAAGVWQKLRHSALPVNFDELEAEEDNRKGNNVVKLARQAASGGLVLRGGADHHASEFVARSCFLFSSILMPPLLGQDRSRMAILELGPLGGEAPPDLAPDKLRTMGAALLRRLVDGFPRLNETLERYREALMAIGHSARGADTFGTLLACADLALKDYAPDSDSAAIISKHFAPSVTAEIDDDASDEERCLQHLLTSAIPKGGPVPRSVAEWIERATDDDYDNDAVDAARTLGLHGMRVQGSAETATFAIANYHVELAKLFDGTHWAGRSGTMGVWVQALRRLPGAERSDRNVRFGAAVGKATLMPLGLVKIVPEQPAPGPRQSTLNPKLH